MRELNKDGHLLKIEFRFEHTTYIVTGEQAEYWRRYRIPETGIWGRDVKKTLEDNHV